MEWIEEHIAAVVGGAGRVVVVVGERGSGRTRAVSEAEVAATAAGLRVLRVHTGAVALGVPFEVLGGLFADLSGLPADDPLFDGAAAGAWPLVTGRAIPTPDERSQLIHAVQWLVRRLAERGPLALVVDDLDVADEETVRCLEHVATRSAGLPLLVLVTVTSQAQGRPAEVLSSLGGLTSGAVVRLTELTEEDLTVRDQAFRRRVLALTGGNPALTAELLDAAAAAGAATAAELEALPVPTSTIRTVGNRLRRLGATAAVVADAVFVLGEDATVTRVAQVAELPLDEVQVLADGLAAAALLSRGGPPRLRCPLVERALAAAPASLRRRELRSRAAELLLHHGVPLERVVEQVHAAEPGTVAVAVEALLAAGREALVAGRMAGAERHLRRLLAEAGVAPEVRREAGRLLVCAQVALHRDGALERFEAGLAGLDAQGRGLASLLLGETLLAAGRRRAAAEAFRRGTAVAAAGEVHDALQAAFIATARDLPGMAAEASRRLAHAAAAPGPVAPLLAIAMAVDGAYTGRPRVEVAAQAQAALELVLREGAPADEVVRCIAVLLWCDEDDAAAEAVAAVTAAGVVAPGALAPVQAWTAFRGGRLVEAASFAGGAAGDGARCDGATRAAAGVGGAIAALALMELGDLAGAARAIEALEAPTREERGLDVHSLDARGWLTLRSGDAAAAAQAFSRVTSLAQAALMENPAIVRAWDGTVRALHHLGRLEEARAAAADLLRRAEAFGAPRPIAAALEAAAAVAATREEAVERTGQALEQVGALGPGIDRARALLAAGSALQRAGRRDQARERLREAMDLAHRIGAADLETRALAGLRAAGARPRRAELRGVAALTPAERQVAEHAGRGLTNREIAAALYVTPKTVEWHLRNVFLKLGITDRRLLVDALHEPDEMSTPPR